MKVLIGKTFGLGNACMSTPMIKAIHSQKHDVELLIGTTQDDCGAMDVFCNLKRHGYVDKIHFDYAEGDFDVAVMSIPFDGRWKNGKHFHASKVIDGRSRPDPSTTGLISWKKHEIEYQMENAHELGWTSDIIPSTEFIGFANSVKRRVYLGVGYKKDTAKFWSVKHWGNENYAMLLRILFDEYNDLEVIATGDTLDWLFSLKPIMSEVAVNRFIPQITNFAAAFAMLSGCSLYVGNDTGMMHVAASMGIKCIAPFFLENSIIKSRPWGDGHVILDGYNKNVDVSKMYNAVKEALDG